ncbi:MAG: glycosyltransferase [Chloroflexota bacterium]|jgi:glycosyltransferase involved in cell wall biosynthesis|nr:glycosyltransferase [Chloroflexota bacterium]MDP6757692.1 glycosyltransferase [Chloroflexota bacterium]
MAEIGVSLCMTLLNEAAGLDRLAADLRAQTVVPNEIVITDGGSSDGTLERAAELLGGLAEVRVILVLGANIATGRNRAIAEARGEIVLVTDGGLYLPPGWVEALRDAARAQDADVVFGYVLSEPGNDFETALGAVTRPLANEIDPETYPISGGCVGFRREFRDRARYPEWLDYGEDLYLRRQWRDEGVRVRHVSAANVGFRPRPDLGAFYHQYFNYARGDGEAGMLGDRHALRFGAYVALALALAYAAVGGPGRAVPLLAGALLGAAYLCRPLRRLLLATGHWSPYRRVRGALWLPVIRFVGDMAKILGYVEGQRRRSGPRGRR